jgi:hypothetical protein
LPCHARESTRLGKSLSRRTATDRGETAHRIDSLAFVPAPTVTWVKEAGAAPPACPVAVG